jgi:hypothetical protein
MIRYTLVCDKHHEFESWFKNSAAYEKQVGQGLVICPSCGSAKVEKGLMTPRLGRSDSRQNSNQESQQDGATQQSAAAAPEAATNAAPVAMMTPQEQELRRKLREVRDYLVKNAENVGSRFSEEARKMHYGEIAHRSIYGVASAKDAEALLDEGIAVAALPVLPDDRN